MRLLLDTHAVIWLLEGSPRLPAPLVHEVLDPDAEVFVSTATLWEMSIKRGLGRLSFSDDDLQTALEASGFIELPIGRSHVFAVSGLPDHHKDPFDRLLVAQAKIEKLTLVTNDGRLKLYDIPVRWA